MPNQSGDALMQRGLLDEAGGGKEVKKGNIGPVLLSQCSVLSYQSSLLPNKILLMSANA